MTLNTDGFKKPESNTWKPGKPADAIKGIFTGHTKQFEGQYGLTTIWELEGIEGEFHDLGEDDKPVEKATKIEPGEIYAIFERKTFAEDIQRAKRGQQIIIRFTESRKPKTGGKPYKYVECLLGPIDKKWLLENPETFLPPIVGTTENDIPFE